VDVVGDLAAETRRADHASRADEPRRRDRQRGRRRHRPQPDTASGRGGCRGAHGVPRTPRRPAQQPAVLAVTAARRLIRNARLIDPDSGLDAAGDLLIEGDKIAAIGPGLADAGFAENTEILEP